MAGKQTPSTRAHPSSPLRAPHTTRARTTAPIRHNADNVATDEIRRSGRANKGHHTKNQDALDEPAAAPAAPATPPAAAPAAAPKSKVPSAAEKKGQAHIKKNGKGPTQRARSTQSADADDDDDEEEEDAIIRCVCGDQRDIRGRQMICCDSCTAWQHNKCLGLPEGDYWEGKDYYCEQCKPEDHVELLAAMARGERPWARKKGSKPKSRPSDVKQEGQSEKAATPQQSTPSQAATAPADATTPTPAPITVPTPEASNNHADSKVCFLVPTPIVFTYILTGH